MHLFFVVALTGTYGRVVQAHLLVLRGAVRELEVVSPRRVASNYLLAYPPLHIEDIMELLLGVLVEGVEQLLLESVEIVLPAALQPVVEGFVDSEIAGVRFGRLRRLCLENDRLLKRVIFT